ncbi:hypothetical protein [Rhizobium leguminosarum]|uniref:hypothetical protein n=1 Tax=Rhizobium leguminosarum TaxID=384 RepID=UPI0013F16AD5|nr:hypothetical protein [Rhizobium leguminosarum]
MQAMPIRDQISLHLSRVFLPINLILASHRGPLFRLGYGGSECCCLNAALNKAMDFDPYHGLTADFAIHSESAPILSGPAR